MREAGIRKYYNKLKKRYNEDYLKTFFTSFLILALFWLTVVMVYLAPKDFDKLFCATLLIIFWFSKNDYFWFAFFIIIFLTPGGFFSETSGDAVRRLPIFTLMPKASFSVLDLFLIVSLIKTIVKGEFRKMRDVYNMKYIFIFLIYIFIVTFYHGLNIKNFLGFILRGLFFYTFFFTFPALVKTKKDIYRFMYLFFPFVFNEIFSQIFLLETGQHIVSLFNPSVMGYVVQDQLMESIRPIANGYAILVLSFMFGFVFLENPERLSPKVYIIFLLIVTSTSVILSATRQTIIMFSFILVIYFMFVSKEKPGVIAQFFIVIFIVASLMAFLDVFDFAGAFGRSYNRLAGAVDIQNGELQPEDSLDYRLTVRLPIILANISRSLFLGYGFSDKFFEYYDGHIGGIFVGLLQVGVFGYIFYIAFVYNVFNKSISYIKKFSENNSSLIPIKALLTGISGYVLVNIFIDPIFMYNFLAKPQEIFMMLVLIHLFMNYGIVEHLHEKKMLLSKKYSEMNNFDPALEKG